MDTKEMKFEEAFLVRVVAAGPGIEYDSRFIPNHIKAGDIVIGTNKRIHWAENFNDPKACLLLNGKKYVLADSRDYYGIKGNALLKVG